MKYFKMILERDLDRLSKLVGYAVTIDHINVITCNEKNCKFTIVA